MVGNTLNLEDWVLDLIGFGPVAVDDLLYVAISRLGMTCVYTPVLGTFG